MAICDCDLVGVRWGVYSRPEWRWSTRPQRTHQGHPPLPFSRLGAQTPCPTQLLISFFSVPTSIFSEIAKYLNKKRTDNSQSKIQQPTLSSLQRALSFCRLLSPGHDFSSTNAHTAKRVQVNQRGTMKLTRLLMFYLQN